MNETITTNSTWISPPWSGGIASQPGQVTLDKATYEWLLRQAQSGQVYTAPTPMPIKPDIKALETTDLVFELMERGFSVYKIPETDEGVGG